MGYRCRYILYRRAWLPYERGYFDAALSLLPVNVVLDSYSEAINGNRPEGTHLVARQRSALSRRRIVEPIGGRHRPHPHLHGTRGTRYRFEKMTGPGTELRLEFRAPEGHANYFRAEFGFAKRTIATITSSNRPPGSEPPPGTNLDAALDVACLLSRWL